MNPKNYASFKRKKISKPSVAREFTRRRQRKFNYIFSRLNFKLSRFMTRIAGISFVILLIILVIGFIFISKYLDVRHIDLVRNDFVINTEEIYLSTQWIRNENILFINKNNIREKIISEHPYISSVEIDRIFPDRIRLKLSTYPILAKMQLHIVEQTEPQNVFINQVGMVSRATREDEDVFLIEQKGEYLDFMADNQIIIDKDILQNIIDSKNLLESTLSMTIKKAEYFKNAQELHYITGSDISFWVDFSSPLDQQILSLTRLITETEILTKNLEYVDLRIKGRIYWKEKKNSDK